MTHADLSSVIGRDVRRHGGLASARRIALRDFGAAFEAVRGVGLRRLHADEAPEIGAAARRKIRRGSTRARVAMSALADSSNGLSPEAGRKLSAEAAALGLIAHIATDKATDALAPEAAGVTPTAHAAASLMKHLGLA